MAEESKIKIVGEPLGKIHCVGCGIELDGMNAGVKDKCPECGVTFSARIFWDNVNRTIT